MRIALSRTAVAAFAALCLSGCFVARENILADEGFRDEQIRGIRRGATTRQEILERFGPPAAVARRRTTMVFPSPGSAHQGRSEVPSETILELFSTDRALRETEIVYYYDSSRLEATGVLIIPLIGGGYHTMEVVGDRLWLLIDESTGVVEDYVFREAD